MYLKLLVITDSGIRLAPGPRLHLLPPNTVEFLSSLGSSAGESALSLGDPRKKTTKERKSSSGHHVNCHLLSPAESPLHPMCLLRQYWAAREEWEGGAGGRLVSAHTHLLFGVSWCSRKRQNGKSKPSAVFEHQKNLKLNIHH